MSVLASTSPVPVADLSDQPIDGDLGVVIKALIADKTPSRGATIVYLIDRLMEES